MSSERYHFVKSLVASRINDLLKGKLVCDPINLFVKPEPHKIEKLKEGRFRLISGISMIDGIIDKMLFGKFFENVLEKVGQTPGMIGWNPYFGGHRLLTNAFPNGVLSIDKSSWDWTTPKWLIDLAMRVLCELMGIEPESFEDQLVKARQSCLFDDPIFTDGKEERRAGTGGIIKSGMYLTILLNTMCQILLHLIICDMLGLDYRRGMPFSLGDDTVQDACFDIEAYVKVMKQLGFVPKTPGLEHHIEFIGFLMDNEKVVPAYWRKHLFALKYLKEEVAVDTLYAYQMMYYATPGMLKIVQAELEHRDPTKVVSSAVLKLWMDNGVHPMRSKQ